MYLRTYAFTQYNHVPTYYVDTMHTVHTYICMYASLCSHPGTPGTPGRDGRDGEKGEKGMIGQTGGQGPPGPSGGGVAYTRWGRTTCPTTSGTTLVYEGLAAGSHYNHYGGGANVICIVKDPKYNPGTTTVNRNWGILYGSEYEIHTGQALNRGLRHNHNVPCAVCHVSTRSSQIMVPGTYQCPSGWTPEYSGWLMGGHHAHKGRNMFTCIDKDAEVVPGEQAGNDGNLFYHVEVDCDVGIPCPPYDANKEMSCVVCTK